MKKAIAICLVFWGLICLKTTSQAQTVYVTTGFGLGLLNLETCEYENICNYSNINTWTDVTIGADGTIYLIGGQYNNPPFTWDGAFIATVNPTTCVVTIVDTIPDYAGFSMLLLGDGTFLVACAFNGQSNNLNRYYIWDPVALTFTLIGTAVPGPTPTGELFVVDGQIYYTGQNYSSGSSGTVGIYSFNITNAQSTLVTQITAPGPRAVIAVCDQLIGVSNIFGNPPLNNINLTNGAQSQECTISGMSNFTITGFGLDPNSQPGSFCGGCTSNAGTFNGGLKTTCGPTDNDAEHNGNEVLDANDALVFVLANSNDPDDLPGSIVTTSADAIFNFQPGTTAYNTAYYVFALAGDALNGSVNFADTCLSVAGPITMVWRPLPTVSFTTTDPNLCGGECATVTAIFTGSSPFELTYTTASGTFTQSFSGNSGSLLVCAPDGAPPGSLLLQATALEDGWCICE